MAQEHLNANRVWELIRDGGKFTPTEASHMGACNHCIDWVSKFSDMARKAGFKIAFEIPKRPKAASDSN